MLLPGPCQPSPGWPSRISGLIKQPGLLDLKVDLPYLCMKGITAKTLTSKHLRTGQGWGRHDSERSVQKCLDIINTI